MTTFKDFQLLPLIEEGIEKQGFTEPTPVQARVIPDALKGRDVRACAQTGTGKTVAFVIPVLTQLLKNPDAQALVVVPTRELGSQVHKVFQQLGKPMKASCVLILGGMNMTRQIREIEMGAEIIVGTPGRLNDHLARGTLKLNRVKTFILDEADRMLDMGFMPDIKKIIGHLPQKRQTLLFSATYPPEIARLTTRLLHNPVLVELAPSMPAQTVTQVLYQVHNGEKEKALKALLDATHINSAIIFCRTKRRVNKLTRTLESAGKSVVSIHGNKSQSQRTRALHAFSEKKVQFLVATDIAARGLDMRDITHVINFDVPSQAEDYVHRIGRTGRAKATGDAMTLAGPEEKKQIASIERLIKKRIPLGTLPSLSSVPNHEPKAHSPSSQAPHSGQQPSSRKKPRHRWRQRSRHRR